MRHIVVKHAQAILLLTRLKMGSSIILVQQDYGYLSSVIYLMILGAYRERVFT